MAAALRFGAPIPAYPVSHRDLTVRGFVPVAATPAAIEPPRSLLNGIGKAALFRTLQNIQDKSQKIPARPSLEMAEIGHLEMAEIGRLTRAHAENCGASTEEIDQMLRKIVIGLVTVASLSAMALVPTEASARAFGGGHGFGHGGGFGGHHFAGGGFGGRHFGGMGVGLGLGLGLELVGAAVNSSCRSLVTASGRVVTVC